jgi:DNA-directed RNA polymerase subunit M/transcription elongation factor TFIIS
MLDLCKKSKLENNYTELLNLSNLIAHLTSDELIPNKFKNVSEFIEMRKTQKSIKKVSQDYICPKCYKRETTVEHVQIRSLDEPASVFATCNVCNHFWIAG